MSNTEFKKAFDNVEPDVYMQSRILATVKDKKKKHFPLKPVLRCTCTCCCSWLFRCSA